MVIHFPIALLTMSVLFDAAGTLFRNYSLTNAGEWNLNIGLLFAIVGIITGNISDGVIGHMNNTSGTLSTHGSIQIIVSLGFAGLWIWRKKMGSNFLKLGKPYLIIGFLFVSLLFYGSHLGILLSGKI